MDKGKTSILNILFWIGLVGLFGVLAAVGWISGQMAPALLGTGVTLIGLYALRTDLAKGVRRPTDYEWFKAWMLIRPVVVVALGIGLLWIAVQQVLPTMSGWDENIRGMMFVIPALIWFATVFFTIWKAPRRYESDSDYRRRVGYQDRSSGHQADKG